MARSSPPLIASLVCTIGCAGPGNEYDRAFLSARVEASTGHSIGPGAEPGAPSAPDDVRLDDGVSEDEAVALALWNNAGFQEAIAGLGLCRADLIQAGLLTNPDFWVLFPLGPKQLEFYARLPVEALWLRGRRLAAAELGCQRAAELIVEHGLELVRRVRTEYALLARARGLRDVAVERANVQQAVAEIEAARLRAGDASELEVVRVQTAALEARESVEQADTEVELAEQRLRALLGYGRDATALPFDTSAARVLPELPGTDRLVRAALAARPDVRACEIALEAAGERAGLAREEAFRLALIIDANGEGEEGFEIGPGLQLTLPIFDQGQGAHARAAAELEQAARRYASVCDDIALGVGAARARLERAAAALARWRGAVRPLLTAARDRGHKAVEAGEISELAWLGGQLSLFDARARVVELAAAVATARADLERALGQRLAALPDMPVAEGAR